MSSGSGNSLPPVVSSNDAIQSIVNSLMHLRKGGETESFSRSAITSLVKKLKDKRDEMDALITAVTTNGATPTPCVTIPKTLDGRLQVASRKGFPHVIYAKIWRWPDLHKNELKDMEFCKYGFDAKDKKDLVCVNPYHYKRVIGPSLDLSGLQIGNHLMGNAIQSTQWTGYDPSNMWNTARHHQPGYAYPNAGTISYTADGKNGNANKNGNGINHNSNDNQWNSESSRNGGRHSNNANRLNNSKSGISQPMPQAIPPPNQEQVDIKPKLEMIPSGGGLLTMAPHHSAIISKQQMPENWCSIGYYEMDVQVGEIFKVPSTSRVVTVDGYFSMNGPDRKSNGSEPNRFCLGALSNVNRTDVSEKTRKYIGKGVELELVGEGDVWLHCLSGYAVFIQSYYLDREAGRSPGEVVHKIHPEARTKVFDLRQCYEQMKYQCMSANRASVAQAAAVVGQLASSDPSKASALNAAAYAAAASNGIGVDDLRRLCILRMSFVKGWGHDYHKRIGIKETPCWIEIHLHRALQLCDEVLHSIPDNRQPPPNSVANQGPHAISKS